MDRFMANYSNLGRFKITKEELSEVKSNKKEKLDKIYKKKFSCLLDPFWVLLLKFRPFLGFIVEIFDYLANI